MYVSLVTQDIETERPAFGIYWSTISNRRFGTQMGLAHLYLAKSFRSMELQNTHLIYLVTFTIYL